MGSEMCIRDRSLPYHLEFYFQDLNILHDQDFFLTSNTAVAKRFFFVGELIEVFRDYLLVGKAEVSDLGN